LTEIDLEKFCHKYEKIYIYGAGDRACFAARKMELIQCQYEAFIVSNRNNNKKMLYNHKVVCLSDINLQDKNVGFLLGLNQKNANEVIQLLEKNGCHEYFYLKKEVVHTQAIQILPVRDRCSALMKYKQGGFRVGVLLCDSSRDFETTYRYRAYNICQNTMESSIQWRFVYFFTDEIEIIREFFKDINIITLIRLSWNFELEIFIQEAKRVAIGILYDIDDLVFDLDYLYLFMGNMAGDFTERMYQDAFGMVSRHYFLASKADGYITTNQYLAKMLIKKFAKPCTVIPNFLNNEQLSMINKKHALKAINKNFIIGYFSGSNTHKKDFQCCVQDLNLLMNEFPDITLRVIGYMDFPAEMDDLLRAGKIKQFPFVDFVTLQKLIAEVDINIVPLNINEFTNCKSELKFFEAAIMRTITCASPTYVFQKCIQDGVNGFLCDEGKWYEKIKKIYLQEVSVDKIRDQAYKDAINNYTGNKVTGMIENAYNTLYSLQQ